jgi:hypothetical protein
MNKLKKRIKELQLKKDELSHAELNGIRFVLNDITEEEKGQYLFNKGFNAGKEYMVEREKRGTRRILRHGNFRYRFVKGLKHKIQNYWIPRAKTKEEKKIWLKIEKWLQSFIEDNRFLTKKGVIKLKDPYIKSKGREK